jgi:hypothetical protein
MERIPEEKKLRLKKIFAEAVERHAHELLGVEERLILEERIKRLEKKLEEETVGETVEAHFFGLEKL